MRVLTITPDDLREIARRGSEGEALVVLVFCAAWCDTCTEFRATCERLAAGTPDATFVWLDIEDDSGLCGDIDVENFPTLAILRGDALLHFGVSLPQEGNVARLVAQTARPGQPALPPSPALAQLAARLRCLPDAGPAATPTP